MLSREEELHIQIRRIVRARDQGKLAALDLEIENAKALLQRYKQQDKVMMWWPMRPARTSHAATLVPPPDGSG